MLTGYENVSFGTREDGTMWISFGNPEHGPHFQCEWTGGEKLAETIGRAMNLLREYEREKSDFTAIFKGGTGANQMDAAIGMLIKMRMINARYGRKLDRAGISREYTVDELMEIEQEMEEEHKNESR